MPHLFSHLEVIMVNVIHQKLKFCGVRTLNMIKLSCEGVTIKKINFRFNSYLYYQTQNENKIKGIQ